MIRNFVSVTKKNNLSLSSFGAIRAFSVNVVKDPAVVFEEITAKHNSKHQLAIRDLRHILVNAKDHKHTKFVVRGIKLYQLEGFDFSEEICSLFIKFCIQTNQVALGAQYITKSGYRIGSWLSRKSLDQLGNALLATNNGNLAAAVLKTSTDRGLKVASNEIITSVVKSTAAGGMEGAYKDAITAATTVLGEEKAKALTAQFPFATPSS